MEIDNELMTNFFRCSNKVIGEGDIYLLNQLDEIIPIDKFKKDIRTLFSKEMNDAEKSQINGFLMDKVSEMELFVEEVLKEYPELKEQMKSEGLDYWDTELEKELKELGLE